MEKEYFAKCLILRHLWDEMQDISGEDMAQIQSVYSALASIWDINPEDSPEWISGTLVDYIPSDIESEVKIISLITQGNKEFSLGNFDEAYKLYTTAISMDPENELLYSKRAEASMKNSQFSLALDDLTKCHEINPSNAQTFAKIGFCLTSLGRIKEAREAYINGLKASPDDQILNQCLYFIGPAPQEKNPDIISLIQNKRNTEEVQNLLKDPEIATIVQSIENDPENAISYSQQPAFLKLMSALV